MKKLFCLLLVVFMTSLYSCNGLSTDKKAGPNIMFKDDQKAMKEDLAKVLNINKDNIEVSWGGSSKSQYEGMAYSLKVSILNTDPTKIEDSVIKEIAKDIYELSNEHVNNLNFYETLEITITEDLSENEMVKRKQYIITKPIK